MDALVSRRLDAVDEANDAGRMARRDRQYKRPCGTGPDAGCQWSANGSIASGDGDLVQGAPLRPACKQHRAVEGHAGVVLEVGIVTGEAHDTGRFNERIDAITTTPGVAPGRITAGAAHGVGRGFAALEDRRIDAVIPPLKVSRGKEAQGFPGACFKCDARHDVVRCPARRALTPRNGTKSGQWYRAERRDGARCPLRTLCLPEGRLS